MAHAPTPVIGWSKKKIKGGGGGIRDEYNAMHFT